MPYIQRMENRIARGESVVPRGTLPSNSLAMCFTWNVLFEGFLSEREFVGTNSP